MDGFIRYICDIFRGISGRVGAFSVVGVSNAVVDLGTLNILVWLMPAGSAMMLVLYNTVGLVLANANSYLWNSRWTFRRSDEPGERQRFRFLLQALLNVFVSNAVLWGATAFLLAHSALSASADENVAKILSALVASGVSFFVMRNFVFGRETLK